MSTYKLKIALIVPVWLRVPPIAYGGIESVVNLLAEELVAAGHEVTLFASGDSVTTARLISVYDQHQKDKMGSVLADIFHVGAAYDVCRRENFDIIHDHTSFSGIALGAYSSTPVLATLHGELNDQNRPFYEMFKDAVYYNAISERQRQCLPDLRYTKTVYNAIDFASYPVQARKQGYLLALSRLSPLKGAHVAIEVAKRKGMRLILAGKINDGRDSEYYKSMVEPHIDGRQISFVGEVSPAQKKQLLAGAKCLLFPIQWDEPFGLVMLESMACGTPVITFDRGAAGEVIASGHSGFIVESTDEMVAAVDKVARLDPFECRQWAESKFSVDKMIKGYLDNYFQILRSEGRTTEMLSLA